MSLTPHRSTAAHGLFTALPDLPRGWFWIQSPHDWLIARAPDGKEFFVDLHADGKFTLSLRATAGWWDWLRTFGALKVGDLYVDRGFQYLSTDFEKPMPNTPFVSLS